MSAEWNLPLEAGDLVELFGRQFIFERVDRDHVAYFRVPGGDAGDFMLKGADGHKRRPTVDDCAELMRDGKLIFRENEPADTARRYARNSGLDAEQAREMDPKAQFRMALCRRQDTNPYSKSERGLAAFMADALSDPVIAAMAGAYNVPPTTLRDWFSGRGTEGCRQEVDGISWTGRMKGLRTLNHPVEIIFYWATRAVAVRGDYTKNHDRYVADISKVNKNKPLNRFFLTDPDGKAGPCERKAEYPVPAKPYEAVSYSTFRRLSMSLKGEKAYASKTTRDAAYQRYGGGGVTDKPSHVGQLCWIDDTPVKKVFFVDGVTGIPIGDATLTALYDMNSGAAIGSDLCPGAASSGSVLRTILHANSPKQVPDNLLEIDPNLTWMRAKPDIIGFDNHMAHHGHSVEDVLADAYIAVRYTGSKQPRDKAGEERLIGIFQDLLFNHMEDANYDIERMRRYGFDPEEQVLCTVQRGRELLNEALMVYNVSANRARDGQQPGLLWKKDLRGRKLNVIYDLDKFEKNIGLVRHKIALTNAGIEIFNRRYTPGAVEMKRILEQFERGERKSKGDTSPNAKPNRDDRKRISHKVKIKIDEDDISMLRVWMPYADPPHWEMFPCTDPATAGMPLWLHERCLDLAKREAMEYCTPEQQANVRAQLFEHIANVDAQAAERERQALGKMMDDKNLRKVMAQYVQVIHEPEAAYAHPAPEEHPPVGHDLAEGSRKDAHLPSPRSAPAKAKPAARLGARNPDASPPRHADRQLPGGGDRREVGQLPSSKSQSDARAGERRRPKRESHISWKDVS